MTRVVESAGRKEDDRKRNTALIPGSWFLEEQLLVVELSVIVKRFARNATEETRM